METRDANLVRVLGVVLVLVGLLALMGQLLLVNVAAFIWPLYIIGPGVLAFVFSIAADSELAEPFAMLSGILTMVGLVLLYQSVTNHWVSWAYAWALVAPFGPGLGEALYGRFRRRGNAVKTGASLMNIGLIIFLVGLIFFELILNISGYGLGFIGWPVLFIELGILYLLRGLLHTRRST